MKAVEKQNTQDKIVLIMHILQILFLNQKHIDSETKENIIEIREKQEMLL